MSTKQLRLPASKIDTLVVSALWYSPHQVNEQDVERIVLLGYGVCKPHSIW